MKTEALEKFKSKFIEMCEIITPWELLHEYFPAEYIKGGAIQEFYTNSHGQKIFISPEFTEKKKQLFDTVHWLYLEIDSNKITDDAKLNNHYIVHIVDYIDYGLNIVKGNISAGTDKLKNDFIRDLTTIKEYLSNEKHPVINDSENIEEEPLKEKGINAKIFLLYLYRRDKKFNKNKHFAEIKRFLTVENRSLDNHYLKLEYYINNNKEKLKPGEHKTFEKYDSYILSDEFKTKLLALTSK